MPSAIRYLKKSFTIYLIDFFNEYFIQFKYRCVDLVIPGPGKVEMIYSPADGSPSTNLEVYNFEGKTASGGVAVSMYNTKEV